MIVVVRKYLWQIHCIEMHPHSTAPSGSPVNVVSQTESSTSINVTWDEVPAVERNGNITHYEVEYSHTNFDDANRIIKQLLSDEANRTVVLDSLHEFTEYRIRVRAYTKAGFGPYSNQTTSITFQDSELTSGVLVTVVF